MKLLIFSSLYVLLLFVIICNCAVARGMAFLSTFYVLHHLFPLNYGTDLKVLLVFKHFGLNNDMTPTSSVIYYYIIQIKEKRV